MYFTVSFAAQTCAVPPCMNESAYRTFILSSEGVHLHSHHNLNSPYKLLGFVQIPVEWFRIGGFGVSDQVVWDLDGYAGLCEGDTEMGPLIYRDTLRQVEPNRCDTLHSGNPQFYSIYMEKRQQETYLTQW